MEPRIYRGHHGPEPEPEESGDGANYLRRLKANSTEAAPAPTGKAGGRDGAITPALGSNERRQSPRHRCSGSVEFRADHSEARIWGTLTDISLHGCYVEMNTTFPPGTKVNLVMKSFGIRIETTGTVRTSYPFLGMGIAFGEIELHERQHLRQLIEALAGPSSASTDGPAEKNGVRDALAGIDSRSVLNEIVEFFRTNQLLSREQLCEIAKRARRF